MVNIKPNMTAIKKNEMCIMFDTIKANFNLDYMKLKDEQLNILHSILNKKDCMGILGTGFGKSMTYILPPLLLDQIRKEDKTHVSLVISPLRSLMQDQVSFLTNHGIRAAAILRMSEMKEDTIEGIKSGQFSVVFVSPESVDTELWSEVFYTRSFRQMVCLVTIDEAHCVVQWGESFREDYLKLTWLRPVMKDAPFLFLTATCTPKMKEQILTKFCIYEVDMTAAVPNRSNIYLDYKSKPAMRMNKELEFYFKELEQKGAGARKCIIYTRVNPAGDIFEELVNRLKDKAYTDGKRLFDMFVAKTTEVAKEEILSEFPRVTSHIRCLIASKAFGMGVDIPDVNLVIHWGVSSSILDYWQEIGRCARDGRQGEALLLATRRSLSGNMSEESIRELDKMVCEKSCIRLTVLRSLYLDCMDAAEIEKVSHKDVCGKDCGEACICQWCTCCSVCRGNCECRSSIDSL